MFSNSFFSKTLFFFSVLLVFGMTSCRKKGDITPPDFDFHASQMNAQQVVSTLQDIVYEAMALSGDVYDGNGTVTIGQCPEITLSKADSSSTYPAKLVIDASSGCLWRGHTVSGTITLTLDKALTSGNATLSGNVSQFKIDQATLNGQLTFQMGSAQKPFANCSVNCTNFSVSAQDYETLTFSSLSAARTQTEGDATTVKTGGKAALEDDVFTITVSGEGQSADGINFGISTDTPLTRSMDCRWIALGKITIEAGPGNGYIDFGTGACDNQVTIKVGGEEKTVTLR